MRWSWSVQPPRLIDALISETKQRARVSTYALRLCTPLNMAHGRQEFALVGYSEHLERRPLKFVDPIPASRICSACGNIPRLTYILMCGHAFCEPCYESCASTSECVCPLDGDVCDRDDVTRKEYRAEQLLGRKTRRAAGRCVGGVSSRAAPPGSVAARQGFRCARKRLRSNDLTTDGEQVLKESCPRRGRLAEAPQDDNMRNGTNWPRTIAPNLTRNRRAAAAAAPREAVAPCSEALEK
ncbi:hypothetical protein HPB48_026096 [Haemaphysalis longicornis]|uniref:RING-type domain-containing protein n=1 Tax=Haemaphysalis longicornis TaxID=44386 RepID=A0A9J6H8N0_HAELO|nr:hypothetical protein HPB48_026096 [Haemaphysalis longicornis]